MPDLMRFWPTPRALSSVMASQAEGLSPKAFLAVHQPMTFRRQDYGSDTSSTGSETDLLDFLLRESGDGCVITVVLGRSGVGKSHAIRWLHEEIQARQDSESYVLVWVERTRSAKGVLGDLLELPGFEGEEWDDLRARVGAATDGLSVARAARLLRAEMVLNLQSPTSTDLPPAVVEFLAQAGRDFSQFIDDPNVWPIPADAEIEEGDAGAANLSPWVRLAQQVVTGEVDPEDEGARRFLPSDLDFPPDLGQRIGEQALEFWEYLQMHGGLLTGNLTLSQGALQVLNSLLDAANAAVLGVNQTPISELFIQLREKLYNEGKELVLLIEDMTIMSGLQRSLLDVMVQPAGALSGRRLSTIRSALAYTPGLSQWGALPDNVMTRAVSEWWVQEDLSETQIVSRYEALAAGYLNAARHVTAGSEASAELFDVNDGQADAEVVDAITAFGRHRQTRRPLFPLNRAAIEVLARAKTHEGGRLLYNPRQFLNLVLQPLLLNRDDFERGQFPNEESRLPVLKSVEVSSALQVGATEAEAVRLETVVASWGGQPSTWEEVLRLPAPIFRAFGLKAPDGTRERTLDPVEEAVEPVDDGEPDNSGPAIRDPIEGWVREVEEWGSKQGHLLNQRVAREVRRALADLLVQVLPDGWPGLPSLSANELRREVFIHSALGNSSRTPENAIVSLPRVKPPRSRARWKPFVREVIALLRWHKHSGEGLDYFGAAGSFPVLISLADRVAPEAAGRLRANYGPSAKEEELRSATSLLLLAAQAGGGRTGGALEARLATLFDTPSLDSLPAAMPDPVRAAMGTLVAATRDRGGVRRCVLDHFAAFQGSRGSKPLAVDAAGLLPVLSGAVPDIPQRKALNAVDEGLAEQLLPPLREVMTWYADTFSRDAKGFVSWFAGDSPRTLRDEILDLAEQALDRGLAVNTANQVRAQAEQLDAGAARALLGSLDSLAEWEPSTLARLSSVDWTALGDWRAFVTAADEFIETLERELGHELNTGGEEVVEGILGAFEAQLDLVTVTIEE